MIRSEPDGHSVELGTDLVDEPARRGWRGRSGIYFSRRKSGILMGVAGVLLTAVAAALTVHEPLVAPVIVAIIASVLIVIIRPAYTIYLTFILAFTALPAFIPTAFDVAGNTFRADEPFLLAAILYSLIKYRASRRLNLLTLAIGSFVILGLAVGFAEQHALAKMIYDARPVAEGAAMVLVTVRLYGTPVATSALRVFKWILWTSAVVVLAGATTGLSVGGRTEEASLADPLADAGAATRLLTNATFPALALLCGVVALVIARRATLRGTWQFSAPALLIVVLSFSRNSILALAVAIVFAVLASRTTSSVLRAAGVGLITVAVFSLLLVMNPVLAGLPGGDFINTQVSSYTSRVVEGLSSNVQATDSSVQFRASEDAYLLRGIGASPLVGHGFGYAYKPSAGTASFTLDYAPYFAHNFYLWAAVKTGILGLVLFMLSVIGPLWRVIREPTASSLAITGALVGMLAASVVAPVPLSATSTLLFGALVGALAKVTEPAPRPGQSDGRETVRERQVPAVKRKFLRR